MNIIKLKADFYNQNQLIEALDKNRGYGLVTIQLGNIQFGIPLRSNLNHKHGYRTTGTKGLDYSKAVIIDIQYSDGPFQIPSEERKVINENEHKIKKQFDKYVSNYIRLVRKGHTEALSKEYRFSTLINYHSELGI